ncbi:unnamed protein product, partial [Cochlearia groenlandica]
STRGHNGPGFEGIQSKYFTITFGTTRITLRNGLPTSEQTKLYGLLHGFTGPD